MRHSAFHYLIILICSILAFSACAGNLPEEAKRAAINQMLPHDKNNISEIKVRWHKERQVPRAEELNGIKKSFYVLFTFIYRVKGTYYDMDQCVRVDLINNVWQARSGGEWSCPSVN